MIIIVSMCMCVACYFFKRFKTSHRFTHTHKAQQHTMDRTQSKHGDRARETFLTAPVVRLAAIDGSVTIPVVLVVSTHPPKITKNATPDSSTHAPKIANARNAASETARRRLIFYVGRTICACCACAPQRNVRAIYNKSLAHARCACHLEAVSGGAARRLHMLTITPRTRTQTRALVLALHSIIFV